MTERAFFFSLREVLVLSTRRLGVCGLIEPFQDRSPVFGTNYLEFDWFVPKNGAAVLKGFS